MKKLLGFSSFFVFVLLSMVQTSVSSCTKDETIYDTVTVIKTDTLVIQDTAITLQLLTSTSWKTQEIRGVIGNTLLFYSRSSNSNTEDYSNEYITFSADKTGVLYDAAGALHQLTWNFNNNTNTKLTYIVQNPAPLASQTVVYENLRYKNNALLFDQYWTYNNINSHAQVIRSPKNN